MTSLYGRTVQQIQTVQSLRTLTENVYHLFISNDALELIASFAGWSLHWNPRNCGDDYYISSEQPGLVRKLTPQYWQIATPDVVVEDGQKCSISLKIQQLQDFGSISFGVVPESCKANTSGNMLIFSRPSSGSLRTSGWEWWHGGHITRHKDMISSYGADGDVFLHDNCIITIVLDFSKKTKEGTIAFSYGSKYLGIAFENVLPPVVPAISTCVPGCSVEIISICSF